MLTRSGPSIAVLAFLLGCGPDVLERAELDEICGQPAPVRLLELGDDPLAHAGQSRRVGEQRILTVRYADPSSDEVFGTPAVERSEYWAVGECGESPRLLSTGDELWTFHQWPDVLLTCRRESGEVVTVDPEGVRPSNVVFRLPECRGSETPHGVITVEPHDEDLGALVLQPWPDDPWTQTAAPEVLLDPIRIRAVPSHIWPTYQEVVAIREDEAFAITPDDALVSLSLLDRTLTVEATNVRMLESSLDGRWLVWQDAAVTNDDEEWPAGAVFVRDRASGTDQFLAETMLAAALPSALSFIDQGVVRLRMGYIDQDPERYFFLPSLDTVDLPAPRSAIHQLDDGRFLVAASYRGGPFELLDPVTGALSPLFPHDGRASVLADGSGVEVLQDVECCISQGIGEAEGRLWSVTWDGERELLAERATSIYAWLADDRLLTTVDVGEDRRGSMITVDSQTLEERLVDDHVLVGWKSVEHEDEVIYTVSDGERSGLWLTKLSR